LLPLSSGTRPFAVETETSPQEAVSDFLAGTLKAAGTFCRRHE
jgi:hypothetical protein